MIKEQQFKELASALPAPRDTGQGNRRRLKLTSASIVLVLFLPPASGYAQQIIFNLATADLPRPCKVKLGVDAKPNSLEGKHCLSPSQSTSPYSSESAPQQSANQAPFGVFSRAQYLRTAFGPLIGFPDRNPAGSPSKALGDRATAQEATSGEPQQQQSKPKWQYGGFIDLGYLLDFNHPENRIFRSRGTAWHVDRVHLNMAGAYVKKKASEESRWGAELTVHGGRDAEIFGFSATAPNMGGFKFLRHLGPTNVSYIAPVGKGLNLQAGIFSSLIGYDSLYAKDNLNYTRPWGADFTPYLMMGANAGYPFTEKLTGTFFVVNGYWHLARANNVPSWGGQVAYKINPRWMVKETALVGSHQSDISFKHWRFIADTIVERRTDRAIVAFNSHFATERVAVPNGPRAWWVAAQLPARWILNERWSISARPEVAWDSEGRWTLARQTVKALTTTLEYRFPHKWSNTICRLEHRWDDSRGREGGFFRGREVSPGVIGLTPTQHLLIFALMFTVDSPSNN